MTISDQARDVLRPYLSGHADRLDAALRAVLAEPIVLPSGRFLQFEICPWYQSIFLCTNETPVMDNDWLQAALLNDLTDDMFDQIRDGINSMVLLWLADSWERVGGPQRYRPAYAFLHGYREQFDLEQRCWLSVQRVFGERAQPVE